jgi:hypothetical protein
LVSARAGGQTIRKASRQPGRGIPAKLQLFQLERGIWREIPAIIQEFQAVFPEMQVLECKGCTFAGIYFYPYHLGTQTCTIAGFASIYGL